MLEAVLDDHQKPNVFTPLKPILFSKYPPGKPSKSELLVPVEFEKSQSVWSDDFNSLPAYWLPPKYSINSDHSLSLGTCQPEGHSLLEFTAWKL